MKKKHAFKTQYKEAQICEVITDYLLGLSSPEGDRFKAIHILEKTVMLNINGQTFLISVHLKDSLN